MAKHKVCARYGRGKKGRKVCRRWRRAGVGLGKKVGGRFKVNCDGKRVYAAGDESKAKSAAAAASKRHSRCLVFTKKSRVATYAHGKQVG